MRRDEKFARECLCVGEVGGGAGQGWYRCFNITESIKIETGVEAVESRNYGGVHV